MTASPLETSDPTYGVHLGVIPFDRSYWVVPGRLLAGLYPSSVDPKAETDMLGRLLAVGVSHVINLTEHGERNHARILLRDYSPSLLAMANSMGISAVCRRFAVPDMGVPHPQTMAAILDDVDGAIRQNRTVYVHCWGGKGRTATVVGCYLARHNLATGDKALTMIRYLRRTDAKAGEDAPEHPSQCDFVRGWKPGQ